MAKKNNQYFSPKVSGLLATIAGAGMVFLNFEDGGFRLIAGAVILGSGIYMIIKSK